MLALRRRPYLAILSILINILWPLPTVLERGWLPVVVLVLRALKISIITLLQAVILIILLLIMQTLSLVEALIILVHQYIRL